MRIPLVRLLLVAVVFVLAASSCSGSDSSTDTDQASEPTQDVVEPTATSAPPTAEPVVEDEPTSVPAAAESSADSVDGSTDEATADISLIEFLLSSMGVADIDGTVECILAVAEDEGMSEADLTGGSGAAVFVAAVRCSDEVAQEMVDSSVAFDTAGTNLTLDDVTCVQTASLDYLKVLPLADSDDLFAQAAPPDGMVDSIVDECGIDRTDALRVMGA